MTDLKKALQPVTSPLDATIIATMIAAEVARLQSDPDSGDIVDALTARVPILSKAISAARMAGSLLEHDTHPETIATKAAANRAAKAAEIERSKEWSRTLEARANRRAAVEAVEKCREGLTRAQTELGRLEKGDAPDREKVLGEGAVALWTDRMNKAETALAAIEKAGAKR